MLFKNANFNQIFILKRKPGCYFYNVVFSVQQELFYQRKSLAVVVLESDEVLVK